MWGRDVGRYTHTASCLTDSMDSSPRPYLLNYISSFLVPVKPGCAGKVAVKWMSVRVED